MERASYPSRHPPNFAPGADSVRSANTSPGPETMVHCRYEKANSAQPRVIRIVHIERKHVRVCRAAAAFRRAIGDAALDRLRAAVLDRDRARPDHRRTGTQHHHVSLWAFTRLLAHVHMVRCI